MYRTCRKCNCSMDPGEGRNGICDECLENMEKAENQNAEMLKMLLSVDYRQMEMEEFIR